MDLHWFCRKRYLVSRTIESSVNISAARTNGTVRKISDRCSRTPRLCSILHRSWGVRSLNTEGSLQLINIRSLGKVQQTCIDVIILERLTLYSQEDLTSEDFKEMPGRLLYELLKAKSEFPLHSAVRLIREDVVFLYLVEHNSEVSVKKNIYFTFDYKTPARTLP